MKYAVAVHVEGREPATYEVEADRVGLARTRAMVLYTDDHSLRGEAVRHVVTDLSTNEVESFPFPLPDDHGALKTGRVVVDIDGTTYNFRDETDARWWAEHVANRSDAKVHA